ncbi:hypothetical protein GCM10012287_21820 [Streptomyces daqingensis]|uniref:Uncharacterized protein n=1 Tax=Streptomyces daqingensis TaxID=1472640 RepID=A0ABQ2MAM5_9ACTN|nr:hypothetical protein [Streptomyces daqingensis]GGO47958.1 hypothetical protein GCM10012287_21820 [Streptomyces daqingensis]
MHDHPQRSHRQISPWATSLTYVSALLAGTILIGLRAATPMEAVGYVTPFLVIYERVFGRPS